MFNKCVLYLEESVATEKTDKNEIIKLVLNRVKSILYENLFIAGNQKNKKLRRSVAVNLTNPVNESTLGKFEISEAVQGASDALDELFNGTVFEPKSLIKLSRVFGVDPTKEISGKIQTKSLQLQVIQQEPVLNFFVKLLFANSSHHIWLNAQNQVAFEALLRMICLATEQLPEEIDPNIFFAEHTTCKLIREAVTITLDSNLVSLSGLHMQSAKVKSLISIVKQNSFCSIGLAFWATETYKSFKFQNSSCVTTGFSSLMSIMKEGYDSFPYHMGYVFDRLKELYLSQFKLAPAVQQDHKRALIEEIYLVFTKGHVEPVLNFIYDLALGSYKPNANPLPPQLLRHFVTLILKAVAPPFSDFFKNKMKALLDTPLCKKALSVKTTQTGLVNKLLREFRSNSML
eukprot:snap_masked-scaffold_39-processed-gene-2.23-mRNA-1 protein AED:1.00 eAED:1.00 QI:0/0/0/0/1/1/3/0/401